MSSINVKVSTEKLIEALQEALAKRETAVKEYNAARKQYEKEHDEFRKSLIDLIGTKSLTLTQTTLRNKWRAEGSEVEFTFDIASSLKMPKEPTVPADYCHDHVMNEIRNAIALLKMSDAETVSTSTYKGVAQYL